MFNYEREFFQTTAYIKVFLNNIQLNYDNNNTVKARYSEQSVPPIFVHNNEILLIVHYIERNLLYKNELGNEKSSL